ncbi:hypothetical protein Daci_3224 [Delftia acidovorans SPH-1]|uniref:Uncharacterized protein n=1 Tax=Delftia acidovorans (strain DSM 14801 / SPH-1) TaxID=398578 RepID=A9BW46_DELAS|nr:hypothetical protein [Delftia acidovorans]ABX35862.1 hypothetical protein Daci_3224 [Delftia acidovorans SPH-1]QPS74854.1 hypothetical protein I6G48_30340 [Delftia acidovorans]
MSKTETQSEALRLARLLESGCWLPVGHGDPIDEAAAELRRLDAEVRELKMTVQHESLCVEAAKERIEALDAENKALRERLEAPAAPVAEDARYAALWREHVEKLDALIAYCPTCSQGYIATAEMTRDQIIFECGKTAGRAEGKRGTEAAAKIGGSA